MRAWVSMFFTFYELMNQKFNCTKTRGEYNVENLKPDQTRLNQTKPDKNRLNQTFI